MYCIKSVIVTCDGKKSKGAANDNNHGNKNKCIELGRIFKINIILYLYYIKYVVFVLYSLNKCQDPETEAA